MGSSLTTLITRTIYAKSSAGMLKTLRENQNNVKPTLEDAEHLFSGAGWKRKSQENRVDESRKIFSLSFSTEWQVQVYYVKKTVSIRDNDFTEKGDHWPLLASWFFTCHPVAQFVIAQRVSISGLLFSEMRIKRRKVIPPKFFEMCLKWQIHVCVTLPDVLNPKNKIQWLTNARWCVIEKFNCEINRNNYCKK